MKIWTGDCSAICRHIRWNQCRSSDWAGIENGELLRKAVEAGFDMLITMDSSMVHQQKIERFEAASQSREENVFRRHY